MKKFNRLVVMLSFILLGASITAPAYASTLNYGGYINFNLASCSADINGLNNTVKNEIDITAGDSVNMTLFNQTGFPVDYDTQYGTSPMTEATLAIGASTTLSFPTLYGNLQVVAYPDPFSSGQTCGYKMSDGEVTFVPKAPAVAPVATPAPVSTVTKTTTTTPAAVTTTTPAPAPTTPTTTPAKTTAPTVTPTAVKPVDTAVPAPVQKPSSLFTAGHVIVASSSVVLIAVIIACIIGIIPIQGLFNKKSAKPKKHKK